MKIIAIPVKATISPSRARRSLVSKKDESKLPPSLPQSGGREPKHGFIHNTILFLTQLIGHDEKSNPLPVD